MVKPVPMPSKRSERIKIYVIGGNPQAVFTVSVTNEIHIG